MQKSSRLLMGTLVEITLVGENEKTQPVMEAIIAEIERIEKLTSFHKPSDLMKVNDNAGNGAIKADGELVQIVAESLRIAQETHGAFDPTIGAVIRLWQFSGPNEPRIPAESEITEALQKVGWNRVKVDIADGTILLPEKGMALDLGGLVKGYTLNRVAEIIKRMGLSSALVNIGGDILAVGEKSAGKPWRIGVKDPRNARGIVAVAEIKDQLVLTSGDYERYFIKDDRRYHHILDPHTGYPADKLRSVTIVGPIGVTLQPVGPAAFVMGADKGIKLIESVAGTRGFLIDSEGTYHFTEGTQTIFEMKQQ
ncbi:MAG: FAD:protein FMN transferase [Desulfomonilaceae bacterium]